MPLALIYSARVAIKFIAYCLMLLPLWVSAAAVDVRAPGSGSVDPGPAVAVLEDVSGAFTLAEVLAADRAGGFEKGAEVAKGLSLGYSRSAFWLRLAVRNPELRPVEQLLEVSNARISSVSLYVPDASGNYKAMVTGGDAPFANRPYPHRHFVFPLSVSPQSEQVVYMRVQNSSSLIVPLRLWEPHDFDIASRPEYMVQGWYFGMASAMVLFNLLLWLAIRDRIYIYYVIFVLAMAVTVASKTGLGAQYLWPASLVWGNFSFFTAISFTLAAFYPFTRRMLDTPRTMPRVDSVMQLMTWVHVLAPVAYWFALPVVAPYGTAFFGFTILFYGGVAVWGSIRRMRAAYFQLGAFSLLLAGTLMAVLRAYGWVPTNIFTVDGLQLGSVFEMLVLALALADRFNEMRREKMSAQSELVAIQDQLVDTLQASEKELAYRVEKRTRQLQAANARLEALSMVDGLTGIANRRHFDQVLHKEWARLERVGQPLALVMLDVDWFKRYNDHFGHQAGDECLREVALAISGVSRASDLVARYGGEEFVIIAPGNDGPQALQMAQRACDAVRELAMLHPLSEEGFVTLSCGVAFTVPGPESSPENLLGNADNALYEAKAQGRNRVVLAQPSGW